MSTAGDYGDDDVDDDDDATAAANAGAGCLLLAAVVGVIDSSRITAAFLDTLSALDFDLMSSTNTVLILPFWQIWKFSWVSPSFPKMHCPIALL